MALFQSLTSANMVTLEGLLVRYNVAQVDWTVFEYTRTASKRYKYVGLTKAAALAGAAAKMGKYTRSYAIGEYPEDSTTPLWFSTVTKCTSSARAVHVAGNMWSVEVEVEEHDVKCSTSGNLAPGTVFSSENSRDYDDGEATALRITAVAVSFSSSTLTINLGYAQHIDGFDANRLAAQVWTQETAKWLQVPITSSTPVASTLVATASGPDRAAFENALVRLCYGMYTSNEETCDPSGPAG